jgi:putative addiction module CopG family antidote
LTLDGIYSKTPSINSALTQHFAEMITRLVSSGRDINSSEVVRGGLRILDAEETNLPENLVLTEVRSAHLDLVEGRYHQVRRLFARQGFRVPSLHRSLSGARELGELPPSQ